MPSIGASSPLVHTAQVVDPSAALILSDAVSIVGSSNSSVAGEGLGNLGGSLLYSTPATIASRIGTYPITPYGRTSSSYASSFSERLLFVTASGTQTNPSAVGATNSIYATDEHSVRTSVENGGGLVDVLNPQPHPMDRQGSGDILIVECGINVPGELCNSR